jgi:hypothetical protein
MALPTVFCVAFLAVSAVGSVAHAGPFEDGVAAYHSGNYERAAELFHKAYVQTKDATYLFNVAKCHEKSENYTEALKNYRTFLEKKPGANGRAAIERTIIRLSRIIDAARPTVEFFTVPAGAEIVFNKQLVGTTPMKLRVDPGTWKVTFILKDWAHKEQTITVKPGKDSRLTVRLKALKQIGTLRVISVINGADIRVDGKLVGKTPLTQFPQLSAGLHQVVVEKKGYLSWVGSAVVRKNAQTTVVAKLLSRQRPISKKAIIGWTAVAIAVASEVVAWVFYAEGQSKFQVEDGFERDRALSAGFHVGAGIAAVTAAGMLTWWMLDRSASTKRTANSKPTLSGGLIRW